ncbi:MAG: CpXC domain-containing protein [Breznakia sp.]
MQIKRFDIPCSNCGNEAIIHVDTVLNHELEKDRLLLILDKRFFYRKCSKCQQIVLTLIPIVYYFPKEKIAVAFLDQHIQIENYRLITTHTIDAFVETLSIISQKADYDKICAIKTHYPLKTLIYDGSDIQYYYFLDEKHRQWIISRKPDRI